MTKRLTPLIEDPNEPLHVRELLEAGRDFQLSDYDFDKGLSRHLAAIEAGAPLPKWAESLQASSGAGAGATSAAGIAGSTLLGWVALPIVTAGVVAAVVLGTGSGAPEPTAVPPAAASPSSGNPALPNANFADGNGSDTSAVEVAKAERAAARARSGRERRTAHSAQPFRPRAQRSAKPAPTGTGAPTGAAAPTGAGNAQGDLPLLATGRTSDADAVSSRAAEPAPQPSAVQPEPAARERAAEPEQRAEQNAEPQPEPQPQPAPAAIDDARLEREMAMLAMSQRVLHSDPQRALALARQGEKEFPDSMFTQERQQLLLLALVKLGRIDEAKRLARPYLARWPNGPFSDRVRRALASGRVER